MIESFYTDCTLSNITMLRLLSTLASIWSWARWVLVATLFALPAQSAVVTCSHEHVQWKPKAMSTYQGSRLLRGVATLQGSTSTESCYTICATCVCALSENYNCCAMETASVFAGCVPGSEQKLCPTHRAVNTCCRTGR
jgi:hypothetical protein